MARDARAAREGAPGDRGHVQRPRAMQDACRERARVERRALGDLDRAVLEVGEGRAVLHDRGDALERLLAGVRHHPRRVHEVAAGERADRGPREVVGAQARLQAWVGVHPLDHARVDAEARGEGEAAAVDDPQVDLARAPVVGHREQVLGGVDELAGDAEHLAEHVRRAAGQAGERGGRSPSSPLAASLTVPSPPKATTTS